MKSQLGSIRSNAPVLGPTDARAEAQAHHGEGGDVDLGIAVGCRRNAQWIAGNLSENRLARLDP